MELESVWWTKMIPIRCCSMCKFFKEDTLDWLCTWCYFYLKNIHASPLEFCFFLDSNTITRFIITSTQMAQKVTSSSALISWMVLSWTRQLLEVDGVLVILFAHFWCKFKTFLLIQISTQNQKSSATNR